MLKAARFIRVAGMCVKPFSFKFTVKFTHLYIVGHCLSAAAKCFLWIDVICQHVCLTVTAKRQEVPVGYIKTAVGTSTAVMSA